VNIVNKWLWNSNLEGESLGPYFVSDRETWREYQAPAYTDEWVAEGTRFYEAPKRFQDF